MIDWARLRESAGLSQRDAEQKIGVSRRMIAYIEKGKSSPSINMAQKLLDGYGYILKVEKKEGGQ